MRENPVAIDARKSRWDRCTLTPLGSLQIDPGGIAYGSRGSSRSGAPPERAHKRASIPEGSQMDMRPRCGRWVAHVRGPGVFATLEPRLPYMTALRSVGENPVGSDARGSHWDRCRLIPEGSHTVAGGCRAAAHPRNARTNAHRSRRDRRWICDRVAVGG